MEEAVRVMQALKMKKIDIKGLQEAYAKRAGGMATVYLAKEMINPSVFRTLA